MTSCYTVAVRCAQSPMPPCSPTPNSRTARCRHIGRSQKFFRFRVPEVALHCGIHCVGLRKEMLGEELAGNIVRLIVNVSVCSLVLIDEGSVPS